MPQLIAETVPDRELSNLAKATVRAARRFFEIPENREKYERWLVEYRARKAAGRAGENTGK